jgi:transcriptional regulator of acetoin/glycerol metabolism
LPIKPAYEGTLSEHLSLESVEVAHIRRILEQCGGNVMRAAKTLGIDRVTLYNKIKKFNLPR